MKKELKAFLQSAGAFDVRIASPHNEGYRNAEKGYKPLEVWPECKSIIVFAVAMSPESNNTYIGPISPHEGDVPLGPVPVKLQSDKYAMNRMIRQIAAPVTLASLQYFEHYNIRTSLKPVQCKVSGCLAGTIPDDELIITRKMKSIAPESSNLNSGQSCFDFE